MNGLRNLFRLIGRTARPNTKWRIWGAAALVAGVLLLSTWTVQAVWLSGPGTAGYTLATVMRGDLEDSVLASGTLQALELVNVGTQVSGELRVLHVGLGTRVHKGELIAEIDASTQENALRQAEAREAAAQAQLRAKESVSQQQLLAYKRQRTMFKLGASTREAYEGAEAALATSKGELDALKAALEEARVALDTARVNLKYTKIESPLDGVVVAVVATQGQTLNSNTAVPTIVKVAQLDTMKIRAEISEADVVRVSPGQAATFTILGEPDRPRKATLKAVELAPQSVQADAGTGSMSTDTSGSAVYYSGLLEAPNSDGKLRIGMTVQVRIVLGRATSVLTVPVAALRQKDSMGRRSVMVLSNGRLREQWITVGISDKSRVEVRAGLKEGDDVVIGDRSTSQQASAPPSV